MTFVIGSKSFSLEEFIVHCQKSNLTHLRTIRNVLTSWYDTSEHMALQTSGSTSQSKTITLKKEYMRMSAMKTQSYFGYKSGATAILCLPVKYIGGMMMLIRALVSDLRLIIVEPSLNPLVGIEEKIDFLPMTAAQMSASLDSNFSQVCHVSKILLGGGPVSPALHHQLQSISTKCYHSFGMTETMSHVAIRQLNGAGQSNVFHAIDGVQFSVDADDCIIVSGDHIDQDILTNDVVQLIDKYSFIWKGRKDNVINSGGIKIYPELIEPKISELIDSPYFIASIDDDRYGSIVCLFIETNEVANILKINESLSSQLTAYEIPKKTYAVSKFVMTETGKIQRQKSIELAVSENNIF